MRALAVLVVFALAAGAGVAASSPASSSSSPFVAWLDAPQRPAAAFVDPVVAGRVVTPARGVVVAVDGGRVVVRSLVYENHHRRVVDAVIEPVDGVVVAPGALVEAGAHLGAARAATTVRFGVAGDRDELFDDDDDPRAFVAHRARLFVPQDEASLVLVDAATQTAALVENGRVVRIIQVGFGQVQGRKERQGDLKTPRGMYFVVAQSKGPFGGAFAAYYGGHWTKLSYPNRWDARRGLAAGLVTSSQAAAIDDAWARRALPMQSTRLGGGIGFHGWISEWDDAGPRGLSWGCVVLHLKDVAQVFEKTPVGTMVVLL